MEIFHLRLKHLGEKERNLQVKYDNFKCLSLEWKLVVLHTTTCVKMSSLQIAWIKALCITTILLTTYNMLMAERMMMLCTHTHNMVHLLRVKLDQPRFLPRQTKWVKCFSLSFISFRSNGLYWVFGRRKIPSGQKRVTRLIWLYRRRRRRMDDRQCGKIPESNFALSCLSHLFYHLRT